jgi:hypothetical protein
VVSSLAELRVSENALDMAAVIAEPSHQAEPIQGPSSPGNKRGNPLDRLRNAQNRLRASTSFGTPHPSTDEPSNRRHLGQYPAARDKELDTPCPTRTVGTKNGDPGMVQYTSTGPGTSSQSVCVRSAYCHS